MARSPRTPSNAPHDRDFAALEATSLSLRYPGDATALLQDIDLAFDRSEIVAKQWFDEHVFTQVIMICDVVRPDVLEEATRRNEVGA